MACLGLQGVARTLLHIAYPLTVHWGMVHGLHVNLNQILCVHPLFIPVYRNQTAL